MTDDLLMGIPVAFPSDEMQSQIAKMLDTIEAHLSTIQNEYNLLVKMRDGFMQELFI